MRRLYLQVYAAFVAILLVFSVLVAAAWHHGRWPRRTRTPWTARPC